MQTLTISEPNERQQLFLEEKHKYIAFGGARGGGKSWAVRVKAALLALRYPGIKITIVRRTYPELRANHIEPFKMLVSEVAKYNKTDKESIFKNGSVVRFRYAQYEKDLEKFQGSETDILFIDEATQFSEVEFQKFSACVRGVNDFPKRVYLTCNPGGVGHSWVKRLFIDRAYNGNENTEDYAFIKSLVWDNKVLMESNPDYVRQLEALPRKLRLAWLEGNWNVFQGQFFEDFMQEPDILKCEQLGLTPEQAKKERKLTHVIEPFEIPKGWQIYRSFDWGYSKPFSCDWWAVDYDGRAYLILQLYGCTGQANEGIKWTPDRVFSEIRKIEKEHRWLKGKWIGGVADPAIWNAETGESIAETAERYRIYFDKGDHARIPGWMQVHYRLQFDSEGRPMVYFFNTCEHAIRTLPLLQFDEHRVEDLDSRGEDHFADSMRYFFMTRPITPPEEPDTAKDYDSNPLNLSRGWYM